MATNGKTIGRVPPEQSLTFFGIWDFLDSCSFYLWFEVSLHGHIVNWTSLGLHTVLISDFHRFNMTVCTDEADNFTISLFVWKGIPYWGKSLSSTGFSEHKCHI